MAVASHSSPPYVQEKPCALCTRKHLPQKHQGRGCRAPGNKAGCYCQLPTQQWGRQTLPLQHSSPPCPAAQWSRHWSSRETSPICPSPGESEPRGCSQGCCGCAGAEPGPSTRVDLRDVGDQGGPVTLICRRAQLLIRWRWAGCLCLLSPWEMCGHSLLAFRLEYLHTRAQISGI